MQLKDGSILQNGKYRIIRVLGQGGFGITYLAEHTMLDTKVAIKEFFPKQYCDRDETTSHVTVGTQSNQELIAKLKHRFLKEAKNISKLRHPGIISIHDIFEENNSAYYVMDFIEGESLSDIVKREGAMDEARAVGYIRKVGEALEYIHSRNMTHFDVKPANIMVRTEDDYPILIDFGLSKQYNDSGEATTTGLMGVSRGFSAIELTNLNELVTFSEQSDVYSLGATLLYLLTGTIPPDASALVSGSEDLNIPSSVKPSTAKAIEGAMEVNRKKRTANVKTFLDCLQDYDSCIGAEDTIEEETEIISSIIDGQCDYVSSNPLANILNGACIDIKSNSFFDIYDYSGNNGQKPLQNSKTSDDHSNSKIDIPINKNENIQNETTVKSESKTNVFLFLILLGIVIVIGGFFVYTYIAQNDKSAISDSDKLFSNKIDAKVGDYVYEGNQMSHEKIKGKKVIGRIVNAGYNPTVFSYIPISNCTKDEINSEIASFSHDHKNVRIPTQKDWSDFVKKLFNYTVKTEHKDCKNLFRDSHIYTEYAFRAPGLEPNVIWKKGCDYIYQDGMASGDAWCEDHGEVSALKNGNWESEKFRIMIKPETGLYASKCSHSENDRANLIVMYDL